MANRLSQLLLPDLISLQLRSVKRTEAINEVARQLASHPEMANFDAFYAELLARERLDTTCLGNEIALPHARTDQVKNIVLAVGRSDQGINFEHGQTARLIFVLGTPKGNPMGYLQVVSSLCKILKEEATRQALFQADSPEAFIEVIVQAESRLGPVATSPAAAGAKSATAKLA